MLKILSDIVFDEDFDKFELALINRKQRFLEILADMIFDESELSRRRKKRRFWVHPYYHERDSNGAFVTVFGSLDTIGDPKMYISYTRMSSPQLEELLTMVGPLIKKETVVREPLCAKLRLVMTLRFLATGESQKSLSLAFKCSPRTVHNILMETTSSITSVLKNKVFPKLNEANFKLIAAGFEQRWNFPNCIGAIDGKHVTIQAPRKSGSEFFNYKKHSSIVLLAICDHNYSFVACDIGAAGRQSDGGIFRNSEMGQKFYQNLLPIPKPRDVAPDLNNAPYVYVADDAFTLTPNMLKPFCKDGITNQEKIFNYRLSRARRVIENSFGILSSKWRIFRTPINANLVLTEQVIQSTVCLHNWLRAHTGNVYIDSGLIDEDVCGTITPGKWRTEENCFQPLQSNKRNSASIAKETREKFAEYFSGTGAVDWQYDNI